MARIIKYSVLCLWPMAVTYALLAAVIRDQRQHDVDVIDCPDEIETGQASAFRLALASGYTTSAMHN